MTNQIIRFKCVLLGDADVGKSSILARYVDNTFTLTNIATVGCAFSEKRQTINNRDIKLDIWDTAGQEKYRSLLPLYYKKARIVLLCIDLSKSNERLGETMNYWMNQLEENCANSEREIFLVGTKSDIKALDSTHVESIKKTYPHLVYIETSAKDDTNIQHLFKSAIEQVLEKSYPITQTDFPVDLVLDDRDTTRCFPCTIA